MTSWLGRLFSPRRKAPENPELLKAMERVARKDLPKTRAKMYRAFLKSSLLIPQPGDAPKDHLVTGIAKSDIGVPIFTGVTDKGETYFEAFSDLHALRTARPDAKRFLSLPREGIFVFARNNGAQHILFNRAGPYPFSFCRQEIEALAEKRIPTGYVISCQMGPGTEYAIGLPRKPPPQVLVDAIANQMRRLPDILEAYLYLIVVKGDKPTPIIGLVLESGFDEDSFHAVVLPLAAVVKEHLPADKRIDWTLLHDRNPDYSNVRRMTAPFYVRDS